MRLIDLSVPGIELPDIPASAVVTDWNGGEWEVKLMPAITARQGVPITSGFMRITAMHKGASAIATAPEGMWTTDWALRNALALMRSIL